LQKAKDSGNAEYMQTCRA